MQNEGQSFRNNRRIAIIYPLGNADSIPSLCGMAVLLAKHGYLVDVFTSTDERFHYPVFQHDNISVLPVDICRAFQRRAYVMHPAKISRRINLLKRHRTARYACIIGADVLGLSIAVSVARHLNVPLGYYSLELLLSYECKDTRAQMLKHLERDACKNVTFAIVQDEVRARLLTKDSGLDGDQVLLVPNSPLGQARKHRSKYLRERLSIPDGIRIVLHSGSLEPWTCLHQLAASTRDWPENWRLVVHGRYRDMHEQYIKVVKSLAHPDRLILSTEPVPRKEYPSVVQSADVGVAFYDVDSDYWELQDNIRYVGLSSGKFAYFMQSGIPVVVNTVSSLHRLVQEFECGAVTEDPMDTLACITTILDGYDTYASNAVSCFNERWDFSKPFMKVIDFIDRL